MAINVLFRVDYSLVPTLRTSRTRNYDCARFILNKTFAYFNKNIVTLCVRVIKRDAFSGSSHRR